MNPTAESDWQFEVFYDGECPLCMREISMLMRMDERHAIRFTDIARPGFDPRDLGLDADAMMKKIHGRLPTGAIVEGVEVFRRLYDAVGFHRIVRATRVPGVSHLLELGYRVFAKNRLRLTGRCVDGACAVPEKKAAS